MFFPYQNVLFHPSEDPTYLAGPIEGKTTTTLNLVECRINELASQKERKTFPRIGHNNLRNCFREKQCFFGLVSLYHHNPVIYICCFSRRKSDKFHKKCSKIAFFYCKMTPVPFFPFFCDHFTPKKKTIATFWHKTNNRMAQIQANLSRKMNSIRKGNGIKRIWHPKKPLLFSFFPSSAAIHPLMFFLNSIPYFPEGPLSMSNRPPVLLFNNPKMNQQNIHQFSYPILFISLLLMAIQSSQAGSYELSAELSSSELQSGKRMSPYVSYQPWPYMKRAPTAPIIRFGKRSSESAAEWEEQTPSRNIRATFVDPLIRFGKRVPSGTPLIRFGRRPADGAPLIRFGKRAGAPLIRFGKRTPKIEENWEE